MQVAEILADLTSLRACEDPEAALRLVKASSTIPSDALSTIAQSPSQDYKGLGKLDKVVDEDMARAYELIELHAVYKVEKSPGDDPELLQARRKVEAIISGPTKEMAPHSNEKKIIGGYISPFG
ncbi:MAG: hypothetical protein M1829_006327 [Trizodia sp. TS-e1964]|nr:MAG: hypothetical protein M1829_006327 [Trizodia sp. TS-e1964]